MYLYQSYQYSLDAIVYNILMPQFSIVEKQNLDKIKYLFQINSQDGKSLKPKELIKFVNDLGLNNELFIRDLHYYFPQVEKGECVSLNQIIKFLDFIVGNKKLDESIEAFKCFDRNGSGQIHASDLLVVLKKQLSPKSYELYSQLISSSFGPLINYMDVFGYSKKYK